jgi:hypothetical protein
VGSQASELRLQISSRRAIRERKPMETMKIIRIVLLINGGWLLGLVVAVLVTEMKWSLAAIPVGVFSFILAGDVAYIWRCRPRTKHASDRQLVDTF